MNRPSLSMMEERWHIDPGSGIVIWKTAPANHPRLLGVEAGTARPSHIGKLYWVLKFDKQAIKRGQVIFFKAFGRWPYPVVDHIDGDSLNDRVGNLREATVMQNAWNHKTRAKTSPLPMGVRLTPSGRFQARVACRHKSITLGTFGTVEEAVLAYQQKRREVFGDYA